MSNNNDISDIKQEEKEGIIKNSILDKIIISKENQEKEDFSPNEVIAQLLKRLNSKEADVLKRRFGLSDNEKETLEVIGKRYDVTRERIRQIENLAIKKIKEDKDFSELIKPVENVLTKTIDQHGNIMEEKYFLQQLFFVSNNSSNEKAVLFILAELLDNKFKKVIANDKYRKSWSLKVVSLDFIDEIINELAKIVSEKNNPLKLDELFELFKEVNFYKDNVNKIDEKVIESFLELSQKIARNPFNEYGLKEWGSVLPKRMNDKIYLVLKKNEKPMHFVDIASKISQIFKKKAYPPTVHNELILNKRYVLVGRGIYALKEWGYEKGVVADVLISILKKAGRPMSKKELVEQVLKQRIVKKNTIYLALTNKKNFKKLKDSRYILLAD